MSWYQERLITIKEEVEKDLRSPFVKEIIYPMDHLVAITFIVTNMQSDEDFNKIKTELLKVNGVTDVKRRLSKKVVVEYDYTKVGLHHLTMALDKTGYKYVKRA